MRYESFKIERPLSVDMAEVARQLQECAMACHQAFAFNAPKEAGMNLAYLHLKRLQACSEICETTARLLVREGVEMDQLCTITARICQQCADSCDQAKNTALEEVADICRQAAKACLAIKATV